MLAVIQAFKILKNQKFNLYTDSKYVTGLFPHIETAIIPFHKTEISNLLFQLQAVLLDRHLPFFIGHIRAHSHLPGPLTFGNELADKLTRTLVLLINEDEISQAVKSHAFTIKILRHYYYSLALLENSLARLLKTVKPVRLLFKAALFGELTLED